MRHLARRAVLGTAGAVACWAYADPGPLAALLAWGAAWALALFAVSVWLAWAGPAWWVALAPASARAAHRYRRSHGQLRYLLRPWRRKPPGRPHIPVRLRRRVWGIDGHYCVACAAGCWRPGDLAPDDTRLHLDHVKPYAWGGLTSGWNLVTLCRYHNLVKSTFWVGPGGRWHYRHQSGYGDLTGVAAYEIYRAELAARRDVRRLLGLAA